MRNIEFERYIFPADHVTSGTTQQTQNTMSSTIRAESELSSSIEIDTRGDIWLSSLRILSQNIKFPTKCKQEKKSYLNCANIQRIYE